MEQGGRKEILRLRIAEISLKRLWGRRRISPEFVEEVAEWLSGAGVMLFFADSTYAVVNRRHPQLPDDTLQPFAERGQQMHSGHIADSAAPQPLAGNRHPRRYAAFQLIRIKTSSSSTASRPRASPSHM